MKALKQLQNMTTSEETDKTSRKGPSSYLPEWPQNAFAMTKRTSGSTTSMNDMSSTGGTSWVTQPEPMLVPPLVPTQIITSPSKKQSQ